MPSCGNCVVSLMRVKICGITDAADAHDAVAAGADALGFVFYHASKRCISAAAAREIIAQLPPFVSKVGLFVNADRAEIEHTVAYCGLDTLQLHGDETAQQCRYAGVKVIKALRVRGELAAAEVASYPVDAVLLDAWSDKGYGGTGELCRWDVAAKLAAQFPIILAGGLNAANVAAAIAAVQPYAVDVSSGVELAPGRKDRAKVSAFIANAKQCRRAQHV